MTKEKLCKNNTGVLTVVFTDMAPYEFVHESPLHRTRDVVLTKEQLTLLGCYKNETIYGVIVEPRPHVDGRWEEEFHQYVTGDVTVLVVNYGGVELGVPCCKRLVRFRLTPEQIEALEKRHTHSRHSGKPSVERDVYETVSDAVITIKGRNERHF